MNEQDIKDLVEKQRNFFHSGITLDIDYRIQALKKLKACIQQNENLICMH